MSRDSLLSHVSKAGKRASGCKDQGMRGIDLDRCNLLSRGRSATAQPRNVRAPCKADGGRKGVTGHKEKKEKRRATEPNYVSWITTAAVDPVDV